MNKEKQKFSIPAIAMAAALSLGGAESANALSYDPNFPPTAKERAADAKMMHGDTDGVFFYLVVAETIDEVKQLQVKSKEKLKTIYNSAIEKAKKRRTTIISTDLSEYDKLYPGFIKQLDRLFDDIMYDDIKNLEFRPHKLEERHKAEQKAETEKQR